MVACSLSLLLSSLFSFFHKYIFFFFSFSHPFFIIYFLAFSLFYSKAGLHQSIFLTKTAFGETFSPILGLLWKNQVCNDGSLLLNVFHHQRASRYIVDVALMFSSIICPLFFLIST
jgi:hypothetical protein